MGNFNCTPAEVKEAKMFTFYLWKDFILPVANDETFYVFVSQKHNEQGILPFVDWKLAYM